jgi:RNA polymerase-binding protein DksA
MARSPRKSLTGSAAAAARKAIGRVRGSGDDTGAAAAADEGSATGTAKKSPAKKTTAKKTTPEKTTAKKTTPEKTAAKKITAKKTTAKKTAAKKTTAKKTAAKKTATAKATATKTPGKKTAATAAPTKGTPTSTAKKAAGPKKAATKKAATRKAATASGSTGAAGGTAKATAKKAATEAPVSALVVREDEVAWTPEELAEVLEELHTHRDRLTALLQDHEVELAGLMRDAGDGAGHDQADLGATSFERDQELTVLNNEREMLAQIERALQRIDDGTYGICESCGQPIGKGRLMAFPRATLCLSCKQREERR